MCPSKSILIGAALIGTAAWAAVSVPTIDFPAGSGGVSLPSLFAQPTGQTVSVQIAGATGEGGSTSAAVNVNSSQASTSGADGTTENQAHQVTVDHTGTGSVQVQHGSPLFAGVGVSPVIGLQTPALGLGIPQAGLLGLGLGVGPGPLGLMGLGTGLSPSLLGIGLTNGLPGLGVPLLP